MLRIMSLILVLVSIVAVAGLASVLFSGEASPVVSLVGDFVCEDGKSLAVGEGTPLFDGAQPLVCDDPDSPYDSFPNGALVQLGLVSLLPAGIALWFFQISSRWKAAGEYSRAMGYSNDSPSTIDLSHLSLDELTARMSNLKFRVQRGELTMEQVLEETRAITQEVSRRSANRELKPF